MSDNVVKFRRIEKKPEPPPRKPRGPAPSWVPFVALIAVAVLLYFVQQTGVLGG
jgi:amino acid transporter